jgi:predicted dienelactone hydrolase
LYVGAQQTVRLTEIFGAWVADIAFVVDRLERLNASDPSGRFTGRLDMTRLGVFGHSFGGAQAAQFCHDDARCKAAVDVDGAPFGSVIQSGLTQPFMFLLSGHGDPKDAESREILANIQSIYDRLPADNRLCVEIRGANHFLFSDDSALMKSRVLLGALRLARVVGIDGPRQLAVTAYCLRSFFDAHLKGMPASPLNLSSPLYPEVHVLNGAR